MKIILAIDRRARAFHDPAMKDVPRGQDLAPLAAHVISAAILAFLMAAFAVLFSGLGIQRCRSLQSLWPRDFAVFTQALHHAVEGGGFTHTVLQEGSLFDFRSFYILHLHRFILPFLPGSLPERMVLLQCVLIALAAAPIYFLAWRRTRSHVLSLLVPALFLTYPLVHAIALADFNPQALLIPLLIFLFVSFEYGRPALFLFAALLTLAVKDHAFVYLLLFAAYGLFRKRGAFRVLAPAGLAAAYIIAHSWLLPGSLLENIFWGTGPGAWREAIRTGILGHSLKLIAEGLSGPFALALAAPAELAMALPSIVKSLAALWVGPRDVYVYYWSETAAFVFIAIPFAIERLAGAFGGRRILLTGRGWAVVLLSAMLALQGFETRGQLAWSRREFQFSEKAAEAWRFAAVIPPDAVAGADSRFLPALAERDRLYELDDKDRGPLWDVPDAWLLFDEKEPRPLYGMDFYRSVIEGVKGRSEWRVVLRGGNAAQGLLLMHRDR